MTQAFICQGCQPKRYSYGVKHKAPAHHRCFKHGCMCGSCNPPKAWDEKAYKTWMEALGGFYIDNTKALIEMVKKKKKE